MYIPESHPDLGAGFSEIVNEVLLLPRVDPHHSQEEMTRRSQSHTNLSQEGREREGEREVEREERERERGRERERVREREREG